MRACGRCFSKHGCSERTAHSLSSGSAPSSFVTGQIYINRRSCLPTRASADDSSAVFIILFFVRLPSGRAEGTCLSKDSLSLSRAYLPPRPPAPQTSTQPCPGSCARPYMQTHTQGRQRLDVPQGYSHGAQWAPCLNPYLRGLRIPTPRLDFGLNYPAAGQGAGRHTPGAYPLQPHPPPLNLLVQISKQRLSWLVGGASQRRR